MIRHKRNLQTKSRQEHVDEMKQGNDEACMQAHKDQDAEVVCRELGCGPLWLLRGALYGDVEAPVGTKEFQCGGNESALLDCRSSGSARKSCSPGEAVGLTCSEPVRLVGGDSRCGGTVEVKHLGEWRQVVGGDWPLKTAAVVCEHLDCGSAVSVGERKESSERDVWRINHYCVQSGSSLRDCVTPSQSSSSLQTVTCSDSVRLLNGTSVCSGRLEVKSNQSWFSVCQADFDQQDAEVVCRELGCGPLWFLRGALYGDVEAPVGTKEFQCGEPVRLVGGNSRCGGTVEVKDLGKWRPVRGGDWSLKTAAVVCEHLDCGSAVSAGWRKESSERDVWRINPYCVQSGSSLRYCVTPSSSSSLQTVTCSDLLLQPNISASINGVSQDQQQGLRVPKGSSFTISCSIQPQYPGGSFQLTFTSSDGAHNLTQPAVNHSADFLFAAAEPAHQGSYSCVYHVYVFSHNFSCGSGLLSVTVPDLTGLIIRGILLPLVLLLENLVLWFYWKARRGRSLSRPDNIEMVEMIVRVGAAGRGAAEEGGAVGGEEELIGGEEELIGAVLGKEEL
ncbi:scavenger receptor cysteine-rich type 1 protein M130-like [Pholidichthys leucotaenia]